jgi:hypothetical protein
MAGKIRRHLDEIISTVSNNNVILQNTTRTKLILKGLDPNKFSDNTEDDPVVLAKVLAVAKEFNVTLSN